MTAARNPIDTVRRAAMGKIHKAAKQLGLEDDDYRAVLMRATGCNSCKSMTLAQLDLAVAEMKRLGWQEEPPKERAAKRRKDAPPQIRKVHAVWNALVAAGGVEGLSSISSKIESETMLRGFVEKMTGVSSPDWLRGQKANVVIEALKDRLDRAQKKETKQ